MTSEAINEQLSPLWGKDHVWWPRLFLTTVAGPDKPTLDLSYAVIVHDVPANSSTRGFIYHDGKMGLTPSTIGAFTEKFASMSVYAQRFQDSYGDQLRLQVFGLS